MTKSKYDWIRPGDKARIGTTILGMTEHRNGEIVASLNTRESDEVEIIETWRYSGSGRRVRVRLLAPNFGETILWAADLIAYDKRES